MGEWECTSDTLCMYRLTGAARPYGSVVQYKDTARADGDWDATVTAARLDDDTTIAEGVSSMRRRRRSSSTRRAMPVRYERRPCMSRVGDGEEDPHGRRHRTEQRHCGRRNHARD